MWSRINWIVLRSYRNISNIASSSGETGSNLALPKPSNPFVETPQVWINSFDEIEERKIALVDLHPTIFRTRPRLDILHRNITWQSNYRNVQLTKQLSKAEMTGGGRKPWPQKKIGRAHVGSIRAPNFIRGGFANGVRGPRTWFYMLPDAIRLQGLCIALTVKHVQNDLQIVDSLDGLPEDADAQYLHDLAERRNWGYSILFVNETDEVKGGLAAAERIPSFTVMPLQGLNCFSLMKYDTVVFSKNALSLLEERLTKQLNRAETMNKKYRYLDYKENILKEAGVEKEKMPPVV